jgi:hypothetical protein
MQNCNEAVRLPRKGDIWIAQHTLWRVLDVDEAGGQVTILSMFYVYDPRAFAVSPNTKTIVPLAHFCDQWRLMSSSRR